MSTTPTPWDVFVGNANGKGLVRIEARHDSAEAGIHVASLTRGKVSEANAELIVHCVNTHATLVAALEDMITLAKDAIQHDEEDDMKRQDRARIEKAEMALAALATARQEVK